MSITANSISPAATPSTLMFQEAADASTVVAAQLEQNQSLITAAAERIRAFKPRALVTMARGSSDHAATYAKYLVETQLGLLTSSASPSVSSVYKVAQQLEGTLYMALSQSGKSPDLLASVEQAKLSGALTIALVNVEDSPLAAMADIVIPLRAGTESSVAATKSYIATLSAIVHLTTELSGDPTLKKACTQLPALLTQAWENDWSQTGINVLQNAHNLFVIGRGLGFGIALEGALKFKETCGLHAEGYSAAEVKHGPMAIVGKDFPVLAFAQQDETRTSLDEMVADFSARGAKVLYAAEGATGDYALPVVAGAHPIIAPLLAVQSFYRMANSIALSRGFNPDTPLYLNKVTETL